MHFGDFFIVWIVSSRLTDGFRHRHVTRRVRTPNGMTSIHPRVSCQVVEIYCSDLFPALSVAPSFNYGPVLPLPVYRRREGCVRMPSLCVEVAKNLWTSCEADVPKIQKNVSISRTSMRGVAFLNIVVPHQLLTQPPTASPAFPSALL